MQDAILFDKKGHLPTCWGFKDTNARNKPCLSIAPNQKNYKDYNLASILDVDKKLLLPKQELLPKAKDVKEAHNTISEAILKGKDNLLIENPLEKVLIAQPYLKHIVKKREQGREIYSNFIIPTLQNPLEIWATKYNDNGIRRHYIALFEGNVNGFVIVKIAKDSSLFWNFIRIKKEDITYLDRRRVGTLMYSK